MAIRLRVQIFIGQTARSSKGCTHQTVGGHDRPIDSGNTGAKLYTATSAILLFVRYIVRAVILFRILYLLAK